MNVSNYLIVLKILHISLCSGLLIFFVFIQWGLGSNFIDANIPMEISYIIIGLTFFGAFFLAPFIFQKICNQGKPETAPATLFKIYQGGFIVQMAIMEACGLLCLIFYFITQWMPLLFMALLTLFFMIYRRPSKMDMEKKVFKTAQQKSYLNANNNFL